MRAVSYALLLVALPALLVSGCKLLDPDECSETLLDESHELSLFGSGKVNLWDDVDEAMSVPAGIPVSVKMYKRHCGGSLSGELRYDFVTAGDQSGTLVSQSLGNWSITVNNTKDELLLDFYINNSPTVAQSEVIPVGKEVSRGSGLTYQFMFNCSESVADCHGLQYWRWDYR